MKIETRDISDLDDQEVDECQVLIVSVIEELESKYIDNHLERLGATKKPQTRAERLKDLQRWSLPRSGEKDNLEVLTRCLKAAGNGTAGIELSHILHTQLRPRLVVFCGIAGSLNSEEAHLGNVVVAKSIHWRGFDKISGDSLAKEMRKKSLGDFNTNDRLLNSIQSFIRYNEDSDDPCARSLTKTDRDSGFWRDAQDWVRSAAEDDELRDEVRSFDPQEYFDRVKPIVKVGKVMSWDFVLNDKATKQSVATEDRSLLAVEMECGGMALAIKRAREYYKDNTELLVVRGISDLCVKKQDDFFRVFAADNAAAFLVGFLSSYYDEAF